MSKLSDIGKNLSEKAAQPDDAELKPVKNVDEQSMDERKLADHIKSKVESSRQSNSRIAIEGVFLTNVAYLLGFDGVFYDTTFRQFKNSDPRRRTSRNRFKVNKILPTIQNRLARLTQSPPRYDVRPNSNSAKDKDCARLGLEIIEDIFEKQRFNEKRQDLLMSAMQGGHAYIQTLWDPTLGEPMVDPQTGKMSYAGDVRLEVLNCLEVFPDPLAKNVDDCAWIVKAKVRKLDYFKVRYPDRGEAVKEENAWLLSSIYDMKANALTSVGITGASTADQQKNSAIELVYYEKRSEDYPNGRMCVAANGILLEDKELPIGEYDLTKFDDILVGGRYYPEAIITHLRPIQDQYNVARTKMAEWVRKLLAGKILLPRGSNLGQEAIHDGTEVVEFDIVPNGPVPTAMNMPQIPPYAYKEIETMDQEFDFVSGINEVSRGVLPAAGMPAQGMAFLQEQDQTRIGVQTTRNEISYAKVGCCILKYVGKNYELPRILKKAGEGLEYTVKEFVGSDIGENYDVTVIEGSTIPQSKVLKRQDIMNAMNMGLLGDPQDPKVRSKVLKLMEYGDVAEMWKKQALDDAQAKRCIDAIEKRDDKALTANMSEWDNQTLNLEIMNEYRLSDKFMAMDDDQKQKFLWVMEWRVQATLAQQHPEIMQQQQIAQNAVNLQKQGINPGGPDLSAQMPGMGPGQMPGAPSAPGQMDMGGNPMAPPPAQQPVPNQTQLPPIGGQ